MFIYILCDLCVYMSLYARRRSKFLYLLLSEAPFQNPSKYCVLIVPLVTCLAASRKGLMSEVKYALQDVHG